MKMNNKSQSLSINTIIIAAIALAVLVVIIAIFSGQIGNVNKNIGSCTAKNGQCASSLKEGCIKPSYSIPLIVSGDCKPDNLCCLKSSE